MRIMCCEDFLIVFCLFLLAVERLNEGWDFNYGVVAPLLNVLAEECGVGTCDFVVVLGGHHGHHRDTDTLRPMCGECHGHDIADNVD